MSIKTAERNKQFQKGFDEEMIKGQRETSAVELRKKKRTQNTYKRRGNLQSISDSLVFPTIKVPSSVSNLYPNFLNPSFSHMQKLFCLVDIIKTNSDPRIITAVLQLLKFISGQNHVLPYSAIFDKELINLFLRFLNSEWLEIQISAVWVLINAFYVASETIEEFVKNGVVEVLGGIIQSANCPDLIEICINAIGNIIGEGVKYRDLVISQRVCQDILSNCNNSDIGIKEISYWVASLLCMRKPKISISLSKEIINIVYEGLRSENESIIENSVNITANLTEVHSEIINTVINSKILEEILELLLRTNVLIVVPALKVLGNIAAGTDRQTESLLDLGLLEKIYHLVSSPNAEFKKESFFILSNILAGNDHSKALLLQSPCIKVLISSMTSSDFILKKQATIGISNATFTKSYDLILELLKLNILPELIQGLTESDPSLLSAVIFGIRNILRTLHQILSQDKWNEFLISFQDAEGVSRLEDLQMHLNPKIYQEAQEVLREFFKVEQVSDLVLENISVFEFN